MTKPYPAEAVERLRERVTLALERDESATPDVAPDDLAALLDYVERMRNLTAEKIAFADQIIAEFFEGELSDMDHEQITRIGIEAGVFERVQYDPAKHKGRVINEEMFEPGDELIWRVDAAPTAPDGKG